MPFRTDSCHAQSSMPPVMLRLSTIVGGFCLPGSLLKPGPPGPVSTYAAGSTSATSPASSVNAAISDPSMASENRLAVIGVGTCADAVPPVSIDAASTVPPTAPAVFSNALRLRPS